MIYEKKGRKRIFAMFAASVFAVSTVMSCFSGINRVEARISSNLPKSYMSDTFPASYQPYINAMKQSHPNWVFKAVYTGLDWNQAVSHESYDINEGISLVPDSCDADWKKDGQNNYKDGNFVIASKQAVKYMLDPRGHLNDKEVFQFQTLSYSSVMDNIASIEKVLYGTSMYNRSEYQRLGSMINMGKTYSNIILEAAKTYNISAIHLASRIKQETSGAITSNRSINGSTTVNGVVPYNFFNIGATPPNAITNGLVYAANKGWTNPDLAIKGGAVELTQNYLKWGQDTTYFQKFDVNNPYGNAKWLYGSQYMTNILAPTNESYSTYSAYQNMGMLDNTIEFHVPVYENMPEYPSAYPGEDELKYVSDNTKIEGYDLDGLPLRVRSGPGTNFSTIGYLYENEVATRIAKSVNTQWDKIRLDSGIEGYVFRDYTKEVPTNIPVTGLSLNNENVEIKIGKSYNLSCNITPSNATNKAVEWSTSNNNIVSVDNGKITAKAKGEATITAKSSDSGITATCNVKVVPVVTSITLNKTNLGLNVGDTQTLTAAITPDDAFSKEVEWGSSNTDVVSVDNGKITAKSVGNSTITVKSLDTGVSATCNVVVTAKVENITLSKTEYMIAEGKYLTITPVITPEYATNKEYDITSDNENVVVIENGKLKAKTKGQANITFTTKDQNKTVTAKVTVIELEDNALTFNDTVTLTEDKVSKIEPGTTANDMFSKFDYNKEKYDVIIKNANGDVIANDTLVGTGTTINLVIKGSTEPIQTCSVIIYGDVSGDGKVDSLDILNLRKYLLGIKKIESVFYNAADLSKENVIDSLDILYLRKYLLDPIKYKIEQ